MPLASCFLSRRLSNPPQRLPRVPINHLPHGQINEVSVDARSTRAGHISCLQGQAGFSALHNARDKVTQLGTLDSVVPNIVDGFPIRQRAGFYDFLSENITAGILQHRDIVSVGEHPELGDRAEIEKDVRF